MEKLYEVTLCKLKMIDKMDDFYQHIREKIEEEKQICIMDGEKFINIKNNVEYDYLRNPDNVIICSQKSLDGIVFVVNSKPYEKEKFSENEVSLNYLRAIKTRRMLNNKAILEQHNSTYQKRR